MRYDHHNILYLFCQWFKMSTKQSRAEYSLLKHYRVFSQKLIMIMIWKEIKKLRKISWEGGWKWSQGMGQTPWVKQNLSQWTVKKLTTKETLTRPSLSTCLIVFCIFRASSSNFIDDLIQSIIFCMCILAYIFTLHCI